jgi:hypothetical protein
VNGWRIREALSEVRLKARMPEEIFKKEKASCHVWGEGRKWNELYPLFYLHAMFSISFSALKIRQILLLWRFCSRSFRCRRCRCLSSRCFSRSSVLLFLLFTRYLCLFLGDMSIGKAADQQALPDQTRHQRNFQQSIAEIRYELSHL